MRWGRRHYGYDHPRRPAARRLTKEEQQKQHEATMKKLTSSNYTKDKLYPAVARVVAEILKTESSRVATTIRRRTGQAGRRFAMRWRRWGDYGERPKRPKVTKLNQVQLQDLTGKLNAAVSRSPVLAGLGVQVRAARGRFYVERVTQESAVLWGRITPVVEDGPLLLECEGRTNQWYEVARGGLPKIVKTIARDTRGTFHGLGALDASLRAAEQGLARQEVRPAARGFAYADSEQPCTAQEALFHFFGIPLNVLIQPRRWYACHRKPYIVEYTPDRSRVLVYFCASTLGGGPIVGACLYVRHGPEPAAGESGAAERAGWAAYTIRPNASDTIATAEQWLIQRKWQPWA